MNISVHPQVGTVTYLSDEGAPTVVATSVVCQTYFDNSNPIDTNDMLQSTKPPFQKDDKTEDSVYISWPKIGKITTFDGRCLHAAPKMPCLVIPKKKARWRNMMMTTTTTMMMMMI